MSNSNANGDDRQITLCAHGGCQVPERLLLAHARGEVLFITGAGTSRQSHLPDFRELVLLVYKKLDPSIHEIIETIPVDDVHSWRAPENTLSPKQLAEVGRFVAGEYDVVLGMLERRIDSGSPPTASVRTQICELLRMVPSTGGGMVKPSPASLHRSLAQLADRGPVSTIVTTNFDLLLEAASKRGSRGLRSHSLSAVPRPGRRSDFSGALHIHGALSEKRSDPSDIVVSDQDFGELYLRRRVVSDFIYDAARLFHLVLVGYSANDAPMRYLLNAVAADGSRFSDLRERFAFVGLSEPFNPVLLEDWKGRGITPIPYSDKDGHSELAETLARWAEFSAVNGSPKTVDRELKRIVPKTRAEASDSDKDLFAHLVRRADSNQRVGMARFVSRQRADIGWLTSILEVGREQQGARR